MAYCSMDRIAPSDGRISRFINLRLYQTGWTGAAAGAGCSAGNISISGYDRDRQDFVSIQANEIAHCVALECGGNKLWKGACDFFWFWCRLGRQEFGATAIHWTCMRSFSRPQRRPFRRCRLRPAGHATGEDCCDRGRTPWRRS